MKKEPIEDEIIPLYRLPLGLKREYLKQLKQPDPNYNRTAQQIQIEQSVIDNQDTFHEKMRKKNAGELSVLKSNQPFTNEMLKGKAKHLFSKDDKVIRLDNEKSYSKSLQIVYPAAFSNWIVDNQQQTSSPRKPEMKRPTKGRKRWTKFPKEIEKVSF